MDTVAQQELQEKDAQIMNDPDPDMNAKMKRLIDLYSNFHRQQGQQSGQIMAYLETLVNRFRQPLGSMTLLFMNQINRDMWNKTDNYWQSEPGVSSKQVDVGKDMKSVVASYVAEWGVKLIGKMMFDDAQGQFRVLLQDQTYRLEEYEYKPPFPDRRMDHLITPAQQLANMLVNIVRAFNLFDKELLLKTLYGDMQKFDDARDLGLATNTLGSKSTHAKQLLPPAYLSYWAFTDTQASTVKRKGLNVKVRPASRCYEMLQSSAAGSIQGDSTKLGFLGFIQDVLASSNVCLQSPTLEWMTNGQWQSKQVRAIVLLPRPIYRDTFRNFSDTNPLRSKILSSINRSKYEDSTKKMNMPFNTFDDFIYENIYFFPISVYPKWTRDSVMSFCQEDGTTEYFKFDGTGNALPKTSAHDTTTNSTSGGTSAENAKSINTAIPDKMAIYRILFIGVNAIHCTYKMDLTPGQQVLPVNGTLVLPPNDYVATEFNYTKLSLERDKAYFEQRLRYTGRQYQGMKRIRGMVRTKNLVEYPRDCGIFSVDVLRNEN